MNLRSRPVLHSWPMAPVSTSTFEVRMGDQRSARRINGVLHKAREEEMVPAPPCAAWVYGADELHELVMKLLCRKGGRFLRCLRVPETKSLTSISSRTMLAGLGIPDTEYYLGLQGYYSACFTCPSAWVLTTNTALTKASAVAGGDELNTLRKAVLRRLLDAATNGPVAICWGREARAVIKGSKGTCLLFEGSSAAQLVDAYFGDSDMDLDLLICPTLSPHRWDAIFAELSRLSAVAVAELQCLLQRTKLDHKIAGRAAATVSSSTIMPTARWSFIMQPAFCSPSGIYAAGRPPTKGLSCVQVFAEVASFPGTRSRPRRLCRSVAYASANTLHFFNGPQEVYFALFRCMLAFSSHIRGKKSRLHAEILDISIPRREVLVLAQQWKEPLVRNSAIPGTFLLAPIQQVLTLTTTIANATGQTHKLATRCRRVLCLLVALSLCRGRLQEGTPDRLSVLSVGATPEVLEHVPADAARQALKTGLTGIEAWRRLALDHSQALAAGQLGWRRCAGHGPPGN